jgi:hypothetical protein
LQFLFVKPDVVVLLHSLVLKFIFVCAGVRKMMVQNQKLTQKEIKGLYLPSRLVSQVIFVTLHSIHQANVVSITAAIFEGR